MAIIKAHKIKYKKLSGEEVARGYSIAIKKDIIEELHFEDKELKIEVKDGNIIISEAKDENNK